MLEGLYWGQQAYWRWRAPLVLGVRSIIVSQGRVVLVRHDYGQCQLWRLPTGAVKREEALIKALYRKVAGELNARIRVDRLHGLNYNFSQGASDPVAVFVASLKDPTTLKPGSKIAAVDSFEFDHLPESTSPATHRRIEVAEECRSCGIPAVVTCAPNCVIICLFIFLRSPQSLELKRKYADLAQVILGLNPDLPSLSFVPPTPHHSEPVRAADGKLLIDKPLASTPQQINWGGRRRNQH